MAPERAPIGIFDSGVGGLTVYRAVSACLPHESIVYLGDTARVPYGTKSADTVIRYAQSCARVLMERGIKLLVVACNTASAYALPALESSLPIPVVGVVEPGARAALRVTRTNRIGVIGTQGTVDSGAYPAVLHRLAPEAAVFTQACPLFVPLAEEGWTQGEVPLAVARAYLANLLQCHVDTLILGCTHYPLLAETISEAAGSSVTLVDSAEETARAVRETLVRHTLMEEATRPLRQFMVTDAPASFARVARHFLNHELEDVTWVDV